MKKSARSLIRLPKKSPFDSIAAAYPRAFSLTDGIPLVVKTRKTRGFDISLTDNALTINASDRADLMRALGQWLTRPDAANGLSENPPLSFIGLMVDCSRNAVPRVEFLEAEFLRLALMGYNALCLYTEDTYEVKGHPEIGHLRGRYSMKDIKRLDRCAAGYGIELFPCIQTLGHLEQILRRPAYRGLQDNPSVINLKDKATLPLIEAMIDSATAPYKSRRIHLGLDETWGLSRGHAFIPNTPIDPRDDYLAHLVQLSKICKKRGLNPMMWGDIVIGMHKGEGEFSAAQAKQLPKDMKMIFWNYYRKEKDFYVDTIKKYRAMGCEPMAAPGLWSWDRLWPSQPVTDSTSPVFMAAARETGVQEALMTMWGDDGHEAPYAASRPAYARFAEDCRSMTPNYATADALVEALYGTTADAYNLPCRYDLFPGKEAQSIDAKSSLSKSLLWDDPLLGVFAASIRGSALNKYYASLGADIKAAMKSVAANDKALFDYAYKIARVLELKADLHNNARAAYAKKNAAGLKSIISDCAELVKRVDALAVAHRTVWLAERSAFGLEVIQQRYATTIERLKEMARRIKDYQEKRMDCIEELDVKPVPFWHSPIVPPTRYALLMSGGKQWMG
ncbi:MAG: hypothetical protein ABIH86_06700 [Planctomycetota bacterium]